MSTRPSSGGFSAGESTRHGSRLGQPHGLTWSDRLAVEFQVDRPARGNEAGWAEAATGVGEPTGAGGDPVGE